MFVLPLVWAFVSVYPCRTLGPAARVPAAPALPSVSLIRARSGTGSRAMTSSSVSVPIPVSISAPTATSAPPLLLTAAAGFRSETDDMYMLKCNNMMQRGNHCSIKFNGIYFMLQSSSPVFTAARFCTNTGHKHLQLFHGISSNFHIIRIQQTLIRRADIVYEYGWLKEQYSYLYRQYIYRFTLVLGLSGLHRAGNRSFSLSFSFFGLATAWEAVQQRSHKKSITRRYKNKQTLGLKKLQSKLTAIL